jgi:hypothetical protein
MFYFALGVLAMSQDAPPPPPAVSTVSCSFAPLNPLQHNHVAHLYVSCYRQQYSALGCCLKFTLS